MVHVGPRPPLFALTSGYRAERQSPSCPQSGKRGAKSREEVRMKQRASVRRQLHADRFRARAWQASNYARGPRAQLGTRVARSFLYRPDGPSSASASGSAFGIVVGIGIGIGVGLRHRSRHRHRHQSRSRSRSRGGLGVEACHSNRCHSNRCHNNRCHRVLWAHLRSPASRIRPCLTPASPLLALPSVGTGTPPPPTVTTDVRRRIRWRAARGPARDGRSPGGYSVPAPRGIC